MRILPAACLASCLVLVCPSRPAEAHAFVRGDADIDGEIVLTDAVQVFRYLFLGNTSLPCADSADADDSGTVEITDGIYLLGYLFLGGPPPEAPFPECGADPTEDALDCRRFSGCADADAELCRAAGGAVSTHDCCARGQDFPDLCRIGACGCSPEDSRPTQSLSKNRSGSESPFWRGRTGPPPASAATRGLPLSGA